MKKGCLRLQDITSGKDFREYPLQPLNFTTEETRGREQAQDAGPTVIWDGIK